MYRINRLDSRETQAIDSVVTLFPPISTSTVYALNMVLLSHLAGLPVLAEGNRYSIRLHSSSLTSYRLAMYLSSFAMIISHFCETLSFQIRPSMGYKRSICPATVENKYQ